MPKSRTNSAKSFALTGAAGVAGVGALGWLGWRVYNRQRLTAMLLDMGWRPEAVPPLVTEHLSLFSTKSASEAYTEITGQIAPSYIDRKIGATVTVQQAENKVVKAENQGYETYVAAKDKVSSWWPW